VDTIENNYKIKDSKAYLNQQPIYGGKAVIYTTPASNGIYQFRCWISEEKKYYRKTLQTRSKTEAIRLGEEEMLGILTKVRSGHKIFGLSWGGDLRRVSEIYAGARGNKSHHARSL
jgi:hypothetical protein